MAEITAQLVKELREKSGAGMMDCKKALAATGGDLEAAVDWLRKQGLAQASKKAGRVAADGLVGVAVAGSRGVAVEVNSETDFVARNEKFQDFVAKVSEIALKTGSDVEAIKAAPFPGAGKSVAEYLTELVATIGENIQIRRAQTIAVPQGTVASYVHSAIAPGRGKIGVLVALESSADAAKLQELGKQLAMHVAAANPQSVSVETLDPASVARERSILLEQARGSGKPEAILEKMVEGRLKKFYEDSVLLEQIFVVDGENRVGKVVAEAEKRIGAPIKVAGFLRFALGEGIQKAQNDFAAEVAAAAGH
jgi:elongation factor Ts